MRDLHVVALSADGRYVVLAASAGAARGGFRVPLDERLLAAVRGELPRPGEQEPRESTLPVREIQSRLRAGESVEAIARSAGLPLSRVQRFAWPVLSERGQVVEGARAAVLVRGRRGASALPLGQAVDLHLAGVATLVPGSVEWTAARGDVPPWTVQVSWRARGRAKRARWLYDPQTRELQAVDLAAASLGHVDAARPDESTARPPAATRRRSPSTPATGSEAASARPVARRAATTVRAEAAAPSGDLPRARRRPPRPATTEAPAVGGVGPVATAPAPAPARTTRSRAGRTAEPGAPVAPSAHPDPARRADDAPAGATTGRGGLRVVPPVRTGGRRAAARGTAPDLLMTTTPPQEGDG